MTDNARELGTNKSLARLQTDLGHIAELAVAMQKEHPTMQVRVELLGDRHVRIVLAKPGSMLADIDDNGAKIRDLRTGLSK